MSDPAKPESRCTCRAYMSVFSGGTNGHIYIERCESCLNQDAEIQRLLLQHADNQNEIHELRVAVEARADERDVLLEEIQRLTEALKVAVEALKVCAHKYEAHQLDAQYLIRGTAKNALAAIAALEVKQ